MMLLQYLKNESLLKKSKLRLSSPGMMSACTNPILYGFLNENFKKEFKAMFAKVSSLWRRRERSEVEVTATTNTVTVTNTVTNTNNVVL